MKTNKFLYILSAVAAGTFILSSCSKLDSDVENIITSVPGQQIAQTQFFDSQDALTSKAGMDLDNILDVLQANNYQIQSKKSGSSSGNMTVTVDSQDTTTFPKKVTIVYNNYIDSTCDETFARNGEVDVTITLFSAKQTGHQKVIRTQNFNNFAITTDSTTLAIRGTRIVKKIGFSFLYNDTGKVVSATDIVKTFKLTANDSIQGIMNFALVKTGQTDSVFYTQNLRKARIALVHFSNIGGINLSAAKYINVPTLDTISYLGNIKGLNEQGITYTDSIVSNSPLKVIYKNGIPVLKSGTAILKVATTDTITKSFTFTYQQYPANPFKTLVTISSIHKTGSFVRRYSRSFYKWWN